MKLLKKKSTIKDFATDKTDVVKSIFKKTLPRAGASLREKPLTVIAVAVGAGIVFDAIRRR